MASVKQVHIDELSPAHFAISVTRDGRTVFMGGTTNDLPSAQEYAAGLAQQWGAPVVVHAEDAPIEG